MRRVNTLQTLAHINSSTGLQSAKFKDPSAPGLFTRLTARHQQATCLDAAATQRQRSAVPGCRVGFQFSGHYQLQEEISKLSDNHCQGSLVFKTLAQGLKMNWTDSECCAALAFRCLSKSAGCMQEKSGQRFMILLYNQVYSTTLHEFSLYLIQQAVDLRACGRSQG